MKSQIQLTDGGKRELGTERERSTSGLCVCARAGGKPQKAFIARCNGRSGRRRTSGVCKLSLCASGIHTTGKRLTPRLIRETEEFPPPLSVFLPAISFLLYTFPLLSYPLLSLSSPSQEIGQRHTKRPFHWPPRLISWKPELRPPRPLSLSLSLRGESLRRQSPLAQRVVERGGPLGGHESAKAFMKSRSLTRPPRGNTCNNLSYRHNTSFGLSKKVGEGDVIPREINRISRLQCENRKNPSRRLEKPSLAVSRLIEGRSNFQCHGYCVQESQYILACCFPERECLSLCIVVIATKAHTCNSKQFC